MGGGGGCREVFPSGRAQPFALTLLFSKLSCPRPCSGLSHVILGVVVGFLVLACPPTPQKPYLQDGRSRAEGPRLRPVTLCRWGAGTTASCT